MPVVCFLLAPGIGDFGAIALAGALEVNRVLHTLYMRKNTIGDAGASAIANALMTNEMVLLSQTRNTYLF